MSDLERGKVDPNFVPNAPETVPLESGEDFFGGRGFGGKTAVGDPEFWEEWNESRWGRFRDPDKEALLLAKSWTMKLSDQMKDLIKANPKKCRKVLEDNFDARFEVARCSGYATDFLKAVGLRAFMVEETPQNRFSITNLGILTVTRSSNLFDSKLEVLSSRDHIFRYGPHLKDIEFHLIKLHRDWSIGKLYGFGQSTDLVLNETWETAAELMYRV
jgi:hypothetical protein